MKQTIYLCGPISDNSTHRRAFQSAEILLTSMGFKVTGPHLWEDRLPNMKERLSELFLSDAVVTLDNWDSDSHSLTEVRTAQSSGMLKVMSIHNLTPLQELNQTER